FAVHQVLHAAPSARTALPAPYGAVPPHALPSSHPPPQNCTPPSTNQLYEMSETLLQYFPGPQDKIYSLLDSMRRFIARRVRSNAQSLEPSNPRDFIDCFLLQMEKEKNNPNSEFTMENLELTALNLFFAGTETISSTLRYGFVLLMKNPAVLEKMQAEIDAVIGRERPPRVEDRPALPFSDAVIHEIQRCADLIPMNVPHRVTRDTEFRGFLLPKVGAGGMG
ncbi:cytochrome P450 2G1-like, partial [Phasianus colchicus]|uniref:cytochrome P450 2G1-like n=1 Tax=Phasianus colchicus TaxID=9054 RepID=UPI00129EA9C9